jgi:hypothetical protein
MQLSPEQRMALLATNPSFTELVTACPAAWESVRSELEGIFARRDPAELKAIIEKVRLRPQHDARFLSGERDGRAYADYVTQQERQRLIELALRQYAFSTATGVGAGKVRFNLWNGLIMQRLLFERDLVRKPVSIRRFRWTWPLITQKHFLMPLVEKRGIYCFYSKELIAGLAQVIGNRTCLEIAAGDGTLSRFLRGQNVDITACDDFSWGKVVNYPADVQKLDANTAIARHKPEVVLCCWPPAGNHFEKQIFRQREVQTYIVIGSHSRFITGNWGDYEAQTLFDWQERRDLSHLVLPPELGAGVWVFQRK